MGQGGPRPSRRKKKAKYSEARSTLDEKNSQKRRLSISKESLQNIIKIYTSFTTSHAVSCLGLFIPVICL